jgi:hypothetical protein
MITRKLWPIDLTGLLACMLAYLQKIYCRRKLESVHMDVGQAHIHVW